MSSIYIFVAAGILSIFVMGLAIKFVWHKMTKEAGLDGGVIEKGTSNYIKSTEVCFNVLFSVVVTY